MTITTRDNIERLIGLIARDARKRAKGAAGKRLDRFVHHYFANVPPQDMAREAIPNLVGKACAHFATGARRGPGEALVRVYNPDIKTDGWTSDHTIVEIVTDDMPFLLDTVTSELNRQHINVFLAIHPIIKVRRAKGGAVAAVLEPGQKDTDARSESYMHLEIGEQPLSRHAAIKRGLESVLVDVRASVEDWRPMRERMAQVIEELETEPKGTTPEMANEVREFLRWIHDNHFTFLGVREYKLSGSGKNLRVSIEKGSGLGVLRKSSTTLFEQIEKSKNLLPDVRNFLTKPSLLLVTKADGHATVHRSVHMDVIAIKKIDAKGRVIGHRLFAGLFTSVAYNRSPMDIPLLRRRLTKVIDSAGFGRTSHDGKALTNILETFPRDELFQASDKYLFDTAMGILHMQERQQVSLFVRRDNFQRFYSSIVFVPRERYTTELRLQVEDELATTLSGEAAEFFTQLGDSALARIHFVTKIKPGTRGDFDHAALQARIADLARSWTDRIGEALAIEHGEARAFLLLERYGHAFPAGYRAIYTAAQVLDDIAEIERVQERGGIGMNLYRPTGAEAHEVRFKLYNTSGRIPLSDALPLFEDMGFRVIDEAGPHEVDLSEAGGGRMVVHDFGLVTQHGGAVDLDDIRDNFQDAFDRVWAGDIESDGFNALVTYGGLSWRQVVILRAYCKYLRQTGIPFSQDYMEQTLANNPALTTMMVELFQATFDPATKGAEAAAKRLTSRILAGLEDVESADEDRILRRFLNAITSSLRTNFYQQADGGGHKPYLSIKFDSQALDELPLPRPFREIFVYSPRVEGVHLRFGYVARGGLRWSDRPEDFRTEVLGLVKAQQVKNAVIVPVGSKGGFVLKRPPTIGGRDAFLEEGIACYRLFISGLLDITDNIRGPKITPPKNVIRRDDDDPYLVVAADKGTATFSDIANGVSEVYGHWLGDAFASGGSQGYDHKKMGITARGGWESVKRHFREMGHDTQTQDFTCVGVGDMSGDVFGNGMLLSKHIKLVAAFNHLHIFVDPDPDPAKSFKERQRMFKLPRSTWDDYDRKLLSQGGEIFDRRAKSLKVSKQVKALLELEKDTVTPNELLIAILKAEADLLWFGGIGTYIKASTESHLDVGDRANDAIRVNGGQVRAKVIGEGANLGTTQLGRIDYAAAGGRLNTDSIDNSAGVDSSDHEVNIKILLNADVQSGKLSVKARNTLLASMTDEVGHLVLRHNYDQTQAITLEQAEGVHALDNQQRLMKKLERAGRLDRSVEYLPDDEVLGERFTAKHGLYRPEISVLLSYAKIWAYDELLASNLPDDPYLFDDLVNYFPTPLRKKYRAGIGKHRLKREIVATRVTNDMVNRVGGTFVTEFMEKTGQSANAITRSYLISREVFDMRELWSGIEALDNKVPTTTQTGMFRDADDLIEWVVLWFLRNGERGLDLTSHIDTYRDGIRKLAKGIEKVMPQHYVADMHKRAKPYIEHGAPKELALRVSNLVNLYSGCDIVSLARKRKQDVLDVARMYFAVGTRFRLGRLRAAAQFMPGEDHWHQLAVAALIEEIYGHHLKLAENLLNHAGAKADPTKAIESWIAANREDVDPTEQLLNELWNTEVNDLSMIAVASRQVRTMAEGALK